MFCLRCGAIVPEGSEFCPKCGLKVGDLPEAPKPQPVPPQYVPPQPPQQPVAPPSQQTPPQYTQAPPVRPAAPPQQQTPPQYTQAPPVRSAAPPQQQTSPQYAQAPMPGSQYVPPQPQPQPTPSPALQPAPPQYAQPQPQPRYVQPQYAPRIVDQGPKARGRILLLITSILLALIALISMVLQLVYYFGGSWIAFPSSNFLSGLQILQASSGIAPIYLFTIPFYTASIIVLGISIAGMPAAFSKKSGGFFITTGIIFGLGQLIGFISPLITDIIYYDTPFQEALHWLFTPVNIILSIIEIGLPALYIVGGILNKKTPK